MHSAREQVHNTILIISSAGHCTLQRTGNNSLPEAAQEAVEVGTVLRCSSNMLQQSHTLLSESCLTVCSYLRSNYSKPWHSNVAGTEGKCQVCQQAVFVMLGSTRLADTAFGRSFLMTFIAICRYREPCTSQAEAGGVRSLDIAGSEPKATLLCI